MFFHGGGWILGDYPTHERFVRDLVGDSGFPAVFVNYTPSPEAHYPVAINQAYAATKWAATNGGEIGVDGKRLAARWQQRWREYDCRRRPHGEG
jgi:acetyl esterase